MPHSSSLDLASAAALSPAWQRGAAASAFAASIVIWLFAYLSVAAPGPWLSAPPTLEWTVRDMTVVRGTGQHGSDGLVLTAPDATRTAVVSLNTSFRAREYPMIVWDVAGIPDDVEATLLWYSDIRSSQMFRRTLSVRAGRVAAETLTQDPNWLGQVRGLALLLQGDFTEAIVLRAVAAKPMSALQVLNDRLSEWLSFRPWTAASANGLGDSQEELPLPLALACIAILGVLLYAGLAWWKVRSFGPALGPGVAAIVLGAWVASDVRWQWNLARQARETLAQYAGKSWEERHLAAEDSALFAFIEKARARLPPPPARVFVAADLPYFRYRGAYHLYPYDVYYDPSSSAIPPPGVVRANDYVVVYQRRGIQYDADSQQLRWDGHAPVSAELLLTGVGAALFRIR